MGNQGLQIQRTEDGSPTLSFGQGEWMHNARGALSETAHVYGKVIENALKLDLPPHFVGVGLGLGYTEMWCASLAPSFQMDSYEADPELQLAWSRWLEERPSALKGTLDGVAELVGSRFGLGGPQVRQRLARAQATGRWRRHGALGRGGPLPRPWSVALFDAFSSATSPELWAAPFLKAFLASSDAPAVLTTYAAQGNLNRALREGGWTRHRRRGFGGKRECTLALHGAELDPWREL